MNNLPSCSGCGALHWTSLYSAPAFDATENALFTLVRCEQCGLVRTVPNLTEVQLGAYYATPYYGSGRKKFSSWVEWLTRLDNRRRAQRLLSLLHTYTVPQTTAWRILDIGCGRAHLLTALAAQGCECHGIERQEFPVTDVQTTIHFYRGTLETLPLDNDSFDAVVLWHSLEHVSDPAVALQRVAHWLRPGGLVAIAVPNFGSWQATVFKSAWFHLDLPRHIYHFTDPVLTKLLKKHELYPVKTTTWTFDQSVFGFVQSALNAVVAPNRANALYALLKNAPDWRAKGRLVGWLVAAGLIAPLALFEYLLAGSLGRGATLIIYAQKQAQSSTD